MFHNHFKPSLLQKRFVQYFFCTFAYIHAHSAPLMAFNLTGHSPLGLMEVEVTLQVIKFLQVSRKQTLGLRKVVLFVALLKTSPYQMLEEQGICMETILRHGGKPHLHPTFY